MEKISFTKMSGAGNDFIVIDTNAFPNVKNVLSQNLINKLCNRRFGIGADGLIFVGNSDEADFQMNYFNADGSEGSLCGNGARCAIRFAEFTGRIKNDSTIFFSGKEKFTGKVIDKKIIAFNLNEPKEINTNLILNTEFGEMKIMFADTGSPHVVVDIEISKEFLRRIKNYDSIEDFPVKKIGKMIRKNEKFFPDGTNVNFIQKKDNKLIIRTFERGVEDETLACGTGSAAAAIIANKVYGLNPPIELVTAGGEKLEIDFQFSDNNYKNLSLTGPAEIIFSGDFNINNFD